MLQTGRNIYIHDDAHVLYIVYVYIYGGTGRRVLMNGARHDLPTDERKGGERKIIIKTQTRIIITIIITK